MYLRFYTFAIPSSAPAPVTQLGAAGRSTRCWCVLEMDQLRQKMAGLDMAAGTSFPQELPLLKKPPDPQRRSKNIKPFGEWSQ
jgi:hypothetical protein